jgi:hypothetical protein
MVEVIDCLIDANHGKNFFMTKVESEERKQLIKDVNYRVAMALVKGGDSFLGNVIITFTITQISPKLFIDYKGRNIRSFKINGEKVI